MALLINLSEKQCAIGPVVSDILSLRWTGTQMDTQTLFSLFHDT